MIDGDALSRPGIGRARQRHTEKRENIIMAVRHQVTRSQTQRKAIDTGLTNIAGQMENFYANRIFPNPTGH